MRKTTFSFALFLTLFCLSFAYAEKQYVPMGTSMEKLPILESYDINMTYVFDYDDTDVPMATRFKTLPGSYWYTFEVTNHGLNNQGFSLSYGLLTRVFSLNQHDVTQFVENLYEEFICTDNGKAVTKSFSLKLNPEEEYLLNFNAVSVSNGTVSFKIYATEDAEGDTRATSYQAEPGNTVEYTIADYNDIDCFCIPAFDEDTEIYFFINNRMENGGLSVTILDEFKEQLYDDVVEDNGKKYGNIELERGMNHYIYIYQLHAENGKKTGRYNFGWCFEDNHDPSTEEIIAKKPTCTEEGTRSIVCNICQKEIQTTPIPSTGHSLGEWAVALEPTCLQKGLKTVQCTVCNEVLESEELPLAEHVPGKMLPVSPPTCTEDGRREQRCTVCDTLLNSETIEAYGHKSGEWTVEREATCTEDGRRVLPCKVCGAVLDEEAIPATGHVEGDWGCTVDPTCTEAGEETLLCEVCGEVLDAREIPAAGHAFSDWTVVLSEPGCTEPGQEAHYCDRCEALIETVELTALGHTPDVWTTEREATCTAEGRRVRYCATCGETLERETVEPLGHSAGEWETTREAACNQSGLREKKCSVCGATLESEELPALGHSYTEWEIITEATKNEEGERRRHCIHCGDTQFEKIDKIPKVLGIF